MRSIVLGFCRDWFCYGWVDCELLVWWLVGLVRFVFGYCFL